MKKVIFLIIFLITTSYVHSKDLTRLVCTPTKMHFPDGKFKNPVKNTPWSFFKKEHDDGTHQWCISSSPNCSEKVYDFTQNINMTANQQWKTDSNGKMIPEAEPRSLQEVFNINRYTGEMIVEVVNLKQKNPYSLMMTFYADCEVYDKKKF